jgi:hypothetical protein
MSEQDEELLGLTAFVRQLLNAGLSVESALAHGYEYAFDFYEQEGLRASESPPYIPYHKYDAMTQAANALAVTAHLLRIDLAAQTASSER